MCWGIKYDDEQEIVGGMSLYTTDEDGIVREYTYDDNTKRWGDRTSFDGADGYSGVTTWGVFSSAFFFARSKDGPGMQVWWRDYNDSNKNTWYTGPVSNAPVMEGGGMWGGFGFAFQAPDSRIQGHEVYRPIRNALGRGVRH